MRIQDIFKLVISNLLRLKHRAILTTLGVIIGTAAVVTLISLGAGAQKSLIEQMQSSFGDVNEITIWGGEIGGNPFGGPTDQKKPPKLNDKFIEKLNEIPEVKAVLPSRTIGSAELSFKKKSFSCEIKAIDAKAYKKFNYKLSKGRMLGGDTKKIIIGNEVAKQLFGKKIDPVGKKVKVSFMSMDSNSQSSSEKVTKLKIGGVLTKKGMNEDQSVIIGERAGKRLSNIFDLEFQKEYQQIIVKTDSPDKTEALNKQFQKMNLAAFSAQDAIAGMKKMFLVIYALLGGVGGIALVVASLGITNTMTMAIYERTKEIGLLKALGTSNRLVMKLFLLESMAIGFLGGTIGVITGYLMSLLINVAIAYFANMKTMSANILYTPGWLIIFGIAFATLISFLAGVFPASRASRLSPLNALRHE